MQPLAQGTIQAGTVHAKKNHAETVQKEKSPADTPTEGSGGFEREGVMIHLLPTITMSIHGASSMGNKP